jgi:hypothetical protein
VLSLRPLDVDRSGTRSRQPMRRGDSRSRTPSLDSYRRSFRP